MTRPGVGGLSSAGHLTCSKCGKKGSIACRPDATPRHLDDRFKNAGWQLDPPICLDCRQRPVKEKPMASKPSPAAMKAQVQMITLLQEHFDTQAGAFADGWSDKRIATETGLSADHVAEFRRGAFGEIKEPKEVRQLREDISSLDALEKERRTEFDKELAKMRSRLAEISARWAA